MSMKNQTLYIDRFSSVSSLVVTIEMQFLRLNPERSNLRLCGVLESPKEKESENEHERENQRMSMKERES